MAALVTLVRPFRDSTGENSRGNSWSAGWLRGEEGQPKRVAPEPHEPMDGASRFHRAVNVVRAAGAFEDAGAEASTPGKSTVEQMLERNESKHWAQDRALRKREQRERLQALVAVLQAIAAFVHVVLEPYALCFDDHRMSLYVGTSRSSHSTHLRRSPAPSLSALHRARPLCPVGYCIDAVNVVCCIIELRWARQAIDDASDESELIERHKQLMRLRVETVAVLPIDAVLWLDATTSYAVKYVRLLRLVQALRLMRYLGTLLVSVRVSYTTGQVHPFSASLISSLLINDRPIRLSRLLSAPPPNAL
jgi:hypothetical protein